MLEIDTSQFVMPNGKYVGTRIQRVPRSYLEWMVQIRHAQAGVAEAELKRRGSKIPEIGISPHAVNRASQRLLGRWWRETKDTGEGLHSWLSAKALDAWESDGNQPRETVREGIKFVFQADGAFPSLKSVMILSATRLKPTSKNKRRVRHGCPVCGSKR